METQHIPILKDELIEGIACQEHLEALIELFPNQKLLFVDATLGGAGHTCALLEKLKVYGDAFCLLALDQDPEAIKRAQELKKQYSQLWIEHSCMSQLGNLLKAQPQFKLVGMMADLGFSSDQINDPERGMSFLRDGPLDFRMNPSGSRLSAREYLSKVKLEELERILREYGQERFWRKIAKGILVAREEGRLPSRTGELSEIIRRATPVAHRHGRIHVATRSFQAIRMAVNAELEELSLLLEQARAFMQVGARLAVLSFHSVEDRIVKHSLKDGFQPLVKKPIVAGSKEMQDNPRARSAKLRLAQRI